ncbi:short-chain fatty acyl-CoA regulator family protein [Methylocapsa polymorpha]|uniref:Short-chain fatty acyl-CoA regulator family protein n=1 Tax=Methylocapsa polymorpha TaxID=3080828 RepID=A0ABZ0HTP3_9HYPH|nr:short-chain fatty acyl-CoA regulator family protein [Methylocapsa sp. RX1]
MNQESAAPRKIFAGPRLKRLRRERQLTQARMADELDVSPSYLNLMERNQRPITVQVLIRLTDVYGVDPRDFMETDGEQSVGEMEQILADPLFREAAVPRAEMRDAAEHSPALLAAMVRLYRAYSSAREASEAGVFANADPDRAESFLGESPIDRIRSILRDARNHFPELDDAAEAFAADLPAGRDLFFALSDDLRARHGVRVRALPLEVMGDRLRWYDHHRRQLMISEAMDQPGRTFQTAYQLALSEFSDLLNEVAARLAPSDDMSRKLLRVTLANYFAGAVMMPYARFHEAAELLGYDVEVLAARFGASFEQVAHRLTTLARPNARGVPFFLVRVDIAGNVSKRFSSGRFPFAHSGGTCPLWNVHATFTDPGRILTQVVELTDGSQWFSVARTVRRAITPWGAIEPRFAIGLGCEIKYARRLVYGKRLDLNALDATPIGVNCRLCDRPACPQRAAPPALRTLTIDETMRNVSPFTFKDG